MKIIWIENSLLRIKVFNMSQNSQNKRRKRYAKTHHLYLKYYVSKSRSRALKSLGSYGNSGLFLQRSQ